VGKTTARSFAARIENWRPAMPNLETIARALLAVRAVLLREFNGFEKSVRIMARSDARARLLMTTPAVGPIVALTYACAIDDPGRFKSSKAAGAHFGLTRGSTSPARPTSRPQSARSGRRVRESALPGRPRHADQGGQGLLATQELGDADRPARRHAQGQVALARKLAVILHRMLADAKPFNEAAKAKTMAAAA